MNHLYVGTPNRFGMGALAAKGAMSVGRRAGDIFLPSGGGGEWGEMIMTRAPQRKGLYIVQDFSMVVRLLAFDAWRVCRKPVPYAAAAVSSFVPFPRFFF